MYTLPTAHAVIYNGGIPIFADIDPKTLCIDPVSIEEKITNKTKVILPVHFAGLPSNLNEIQALASVDSTKLHGVICGRSLYEKAFTLEDAIQAMEDDHEFLLRGDVFTQDVIDTWIDYKRENEIDQMRLRPHPLEFQMYYDC